MIPHWIYQIKAPKSDSLINSTKSYATVSDWWDECANSDNMLEFLQRIGYGSERVLRLMGCRFVRETQIGEGRTVWDLLDDERSRDSVLIAERWANGDATDKELKVAWLGAQKAMLETATAEGDTPVSHAKDYARIAALEPSGWGNIYGCALVSAWCASDAAAWSAVDDGAGEHARLLAIAQQADIIREMITSKEIEPYFEQYADSLQTKREGTNDTTLD